MTADEVVVFREALRASLPGFEMPSAYGVGVFATDGIKFPIVNKGGSHYLPAVVLAAVLGYRSGTCTIAMTPAQLGEALTKLAPVEACTAFKHPNLWAWRALLESARADGFVAVFVGGADGYPYDEAQRVFVSLSGNTD